MVGAHCGVTPAPTYLINPSLRPVPPCGSHRPAGPGFVGSGPVSGIVLFAFDKSHKKGKKKEQGEGRTTPGCQGPGSLCGSAGEAGAQSMWVLRTHPAQTQKPRPEGRAAPQGHTGGRPGWPGVDCAGRGKPAPLSTMTRRVRIRLLVTCLAPTQANPAEPI